MTYGPSANWKPTTHAERMAYNKKFNLTVAKYGVDLWNIACVLERYLDEVFLNDQNFWYMARDLKSALITFDSISKKAKRLARIHASKVSDSQPAKQTRKKKVCVNHTEQLNLIEETK